MAENGKFRAPARRAVYRAIFSRRDIRRFRPQAVPASKLQRILQAAHHAPSVGFMQPWNFILIQDAAIKREIKQIFLRENVRALKNYRGSRRRLYQSLKLEGIEEAPLNICVTCDSSRGGRHVLGRNSIRRTDVYSSCLAIENMWLAARAEGIGMGWVSILSNSSLRKTLGIPRHVIPIAYLCVGYPKSFSRVPELEKVGWARRLSCKSLIYFDRWGETEQVLLSQGFVRPSAATKADSESRSASERQRGRVATKRPPWFVGE